MDRDALKRSLKEQFDQSLEKALDAVEQAPDGRWIAASEWQVREIFQKLMSECYQTMLQAALANNWDIGSGPTEATCKTLTLRLKRPGMCHAPAGAPLSRDFRSGLAPATLVGEMNSGIPTEISRRLVAVVVCCVAGCRATLREAPIPSTRPATLPATTQAGRWETFRVAEGKDLRAILITSPNPAGHYPTSVVQVYNASEEDVVVSYEPGSVVVHCGPYELHGPPATFVSRREVLRSNQPIEFNLPAAGWSRSPTSEPRELLIPTELPAGTYPVWATFCAGGQDGQTIETAHYTFTVP